MVIFLAPIKQKKHEWKPKQNDFFWQETLDYIFKAENLDKEESYQPIHNVNFNAQTLTFDRVNYKPQETKVLNTTNEIFYVKTPSQKVLPNKDETGYWCYVSSFERNEDNTVTISLTVDTLSSSLVDFQNNKYAGECYIDRTNNRIVEQNLIHPDICTSIQNQVELITKTPIYTNNNIDIFASTFVSSKIEKDIDYSPSSPLKKLTFNDKGVVISNGKPTAARATNFLGYWSMTNKSDMWKELLLEHQFPSDTLSNILKKHSDSKVSEKKWVFDGPLKYRAFLLELRASYIEFNNADGVLQTIDEIVKNENHTVQKWISIPKLFNFSNDVYSKISIDISSFGFKVNKSNHLEMHKNYYLILNKLFKIPLDPIKIKKSIFVERTVSYNGTNYNFYYDIKSAEPFYNLNITIENGLLNNEYLEYQKNLNIAYETGQKGANSEITETVLKSIVGIGVALASLGISISTGGTAIPALVATGLTASVINTASNKGFSAYRENQQIKYEQAKIGTKSNSSKNILDYESFWKTLTTEAWAIEFSWFDNNDVGVNSIKGYCAYSINQVFSPNEEVNKFNLLIEEPTKSDIEIIETDQKIFGAVQNRYELNCQNPLVFNDLTTDHLFWKGRILPTETYVNSFWIENLNEVLSQGVMIRKKNFN